MLLAGLFCKRDTPDLLLYVAGAAHRVFSEHDAIKILVKLIIILFPVLLSDSSWVSGTGFEVAVECATTHQHTQRDVNITDPRVRPKLVKSKVDI